MKITRKQAELICSKMNNKELDAFFGNVGIAEFARAFANGKAVEWTDNYDHCLISTDTDQADFSAPMSCFWCVREEPAEMIVTSQEKALIYALRSANAILVKQIEYTNHDCTPGQHITIETDIGQERIFRALKSLAADSMERAF